jgi:restriction endonuclease
MSYDFKSLSSADFEELTRDLLQAELGIHLESFKAGKDGGIDLRHSRDEDGSLIVQCKHYSDFNALLQVLKLEVSKVKKLNPNRYILSTSTGCSPQQKD